MLIQSKTIGTVAYLGGLANVFEEFCWCWGQLIQFNNEYLALLAKDEKIKGKPKYFTPFRIYSTF